MTAKQALVVGINDYPGTNSDLSGCVNDAGDWSKALADRGFHVEMLLDRFATKANIVKAMRDLVRWTRYGDIAVITYSGHGTWIPDEDYDEPDRRDEALCPYDIMDGQLIVDDEIAEIFSYKRYGARIVLISDSCHSGSVQRLFLDPARHRKIRFLPPETFLSGRALQRAEKAFELFPKPIAKSRRSEPAILLSGCRDDQYSYDAYINGRFNGAFTRHAIDSLSRTEVGTYDDWMAAIRQRLPSDDYPQTPQLSGRDYMRAWPVLS
jgi:hypothetical protein